MKNLYSFGTVISLLITLVLILTVCKHNAYELGTTFQPKTSISSTLEKAIAAVQ